MRFLKCFAVGALTVTGWSQLRAQEAPIPQAPPSTADAADVAKREAELARREADLANREAAFASGTNQNLQPGIVTQSPDLSVPLPRRTPRQRTHGSPGMGTPLPSLQELRHEDTGILIRNTNAFPGPQDPNDHQNHVAHGTSSLRSYRITPFWRTPVGQAAFNPADPGMSPSAAAAAGDPVEDPTLDFGFQARPGILFDSGFAGGSTAFNPGSIALHGSDDSHKNGQLFFITPKNETGQNGFIVPFRPQVGVNLPSIAGMGSAAIHADMISTNGSDLQLRTGAVRYLSTTEEFGMGFGTMETLFGDLGSAPASIVTGNLPVGTVSAGSTKGGFRSVGQLRLTRYWHNAFVDNDVFEAAISLEDSSVLSPSNIKDTTTLNRYPTVAGRLRYGGNNGFDSYQVAGLAVPLGFENNNTSQEFFSTAYGVSTNARFEISDCDLTDTVYLGAVAGRGIGGYIFGNLPGSYVPNVATPNALNLVTDVGAYASYRHVWCPPQNGSFWSSNFMGGLAQAGCTINPSDKVQNNRQLCQTGCNLLWHKGANTTVGLEYQYASRETVPTMAKLHHGEDHRVMFVLQFAPNSSLTTEGRRSVAAQTSGPHAAAANDFSEAATDPNSSRKSRMRF